MSIITNPKVYEEKLQDIQTNIYDSLIALLHGYYGGTYIRENYHKYIKLSNIIGSPIVIEIKVENNKVLYKSGT